MWRGRFRSPYCRVRTAKASWFRQLKQQNKMGFGKSQTNKDIIPGLGLKLQYMDQLYNRSTSDFEVNREWEEDDYRVINSRWNRKNELLFTTNIEILLPLTLFVFSPIPAVRSSPASYLLRHIVDFRQKMSVGKKETRCTTSRRSRNSDRT